MVRFYCQLLCPDNRTHRLHVPATANCAVEVSYDLNGINIHRNSSLLLLLFAIH